MPQMAPISWLLLFIVFTATLMLFCMMNYFNFLPSTPNTSSSKTMKLHQMNWKW